LFLNRANEQLFFYNGSNLAVKCLSNSGAYVNLYPFTLSARDLILAAQSAT
jgi:hypothetical protein